MLFNTKTLVLLPALVCFAVASAFGQTEVNPDSALQRVLGGISGTPLSLAAAIDQASHKSTTLRRAEAVYLAAKGSVRHEAGLFDPAFFASLNYLDQDQPTSSFFSGAPVLSTQQTAFKSGLRMALPTGTQLELAVNTLSLRTNSSLASLNPEYDAFGSLSLRQPLLGGLWISGRKQLNEREKEMDAVKARYDQQLLAVSTDVESMYWDLYLAERNYAVQILTRDRARSFMDETELRAKTGLVGPDQVASARTFLAQQELLLVDREEQLDRQSDLLAAFIGARPGASMTRFTATDAPKEDFQVESVEEFLSRALNNNLDLEAAKMDVDANRALASAAGWEMLPSLNFVGSLGGYGLGGNSQQIVFNGQTYGTNGSIGTMGDALHQVSRRDFPTWSVGLELNVPVGFRPGLGERDRLEAQVLGAEQTYEERSRSLEEQVRTAYRELTHGKTRLPLARTGVDAAEEQVRIGLIGFRNGRQTAFELVRLGEDLALAQQRYSDNLVRTAKAAATLRRLTSQSAAAGAQ